MKQRPFHDPAIKSYEITPEPVYRSRRAFVAGAAAAAAALWLPGCAPDAGETGAPAPEPFTPPPPVRPWLTEAVAAAQPWPGSADEAVVPMADAMRYNNFYEFGTDKSDPSNHGAELDTVPWTVEVSGAAARTGTYAFEDLVRPRRLEERIYRLRCVEAWSMVVPWVGVPLATVIEGLEPLGNAKYVAFETLEDPAQFRGQRSGLSSIDWPYREGLRMDEAMNPLSLLAVGMYGRELPNQNGAPLRLVVPWKYGFKSIKSIVRIHFSESRPETTWNLLQPSEYGFFANVNPAVDHPRWSQKRERRLPSSIFDPNRIPTQPFNGYGEQVAHLYAGMDLSRDF